jgi:hypothetical protein
VCTFSTNIKYKSVHTGVVLNVKRTGGPVKVPLRGH